MKILDDAARPRELGLISIAIVLAIVLGYVPTTTAASEAQQPLVVVSTELEPFMFVRDGQPAGFEYELLHFFATSQNRELEIKWVDKFPDVLPTLERGEAELAAAALTVTSERRKNFDFANSHFPSQAMILLRGASTVTTLEEVTGRIGVLGATTVSELLEGLPGVHRVEGQSERELVARLLDGELDGMASEAARAFLFVQEFPALRIGPKLGEKQEFAFALVKGSSLKDALNEHILKTRRGAVYYRLVEDYFGAAAVDIIRAARQ